MNINELKLKLNNNSFKDSILFFEKIDSTSTYCKENFKILNDKSVVIAKKQSLGRGKNNRSWKSPTGGLYFSILLKNNLPSQENIKLLPLVTSVAVFNALKSLNVSSSIKWPNDLLIEGKKLCGILVESKLSSSGIKYIVIGIGINVNSISSSVDDELNNIFISLKEKYKLDFSLESLLASIINNLDNLLQKLNNNKFNEILTTYRENCILIGKDVVLFNNNEKKDVKILDVSNDGSLKVLHRNEIEFINSGEFSIDKNFF